VWFCLCDPMFSRFSRTPTCDGQTDGHRAMASLVDRGCIASRGKCISVIRQTVTDVIGFWLFFYFFLC